MRRITIYWTTKAESISLDFSDDAAARLAFKQICSIAGEPRVWAANEVMINCKHILHANLT